MPLRWLLGDLQVYTCWFWWLLISTTCVFFMIVSSLNVKQHNHTSCTLLWLSCSISKADKGALLVTVLLKDSSPAIRIALHKTFVLVYIIIMCVFGPLFYPTLHPPLQLFVTTHPNKINSNCLYLDSTTALALGKIIKFKEMQVKAKLFWVLK